MASIQPIATSRVTDAMTRGRLTAQIQNDQLDLFRLQNQLSTGLRIFLPSDDASASQRAMVLQRTIERKEQSVTNLQGARASLVTTLDNLREVNDGLNNVKSEALGVVGTITTQEQRQVVIDEIDQMLFRLQQVGNATFASNFLLGGAERSSEAYQSLNGYVEYLGDESNPQTFIDIGQLFDQGVSGVDVFGGISTEIRGSNDLNVQLTPETSLDRLNGGTGARTDGAIEIVFVPTNGSEPTTTSVIDLSQAKSIDDVARLIETNAPEGTSLSVAIEGGSLRIDTADGGVTIGEAGAGNAARDLGILSVGVPSPTITGADLDPTLRGASKIDDLVGSRARGRVESVGGNNDLRLTATRNGADLNGLEVYYVDGVNAGGEVAAYDSLSNSITVTISNGESTASQVAEAINAVGSIPFTAEVDYRDQTSFEARGQGEVFASSIPGTDLAVDVLGGAEGDLDIASGLQVTNGTETYTIDTSGAETVEDLLSLFNTPEYGLLASVNASGDGIDVRTRRSGADFAIGENGGTTAEQLGIRTFVESSRLADFNRGAGVLTEGENPADTLAQNAFVISVTEDGLVEEYRIDPREAVTIEDLIRQIALDTGGTLIGDTVVGGAVEASLATEGNGLVLTVTDPDSPATTAQGSVSVPTDTPTFSETFTLTAIDPGDAGNRPSLMLEITGAAGSGGLSTSIDGEVITVDLGGAPATTADIAARIESQLPGYQVTFGGDGTDTVSADLGVNSAAVTGGAPASAAAVAATAGYTISTTPPNSDTITFTADATGPDGNRPFSVALIDDGIGGLTTSIDGDTVTVNLGGADSSSDAIAASIQTAINDARDVAIGAGQEVGPTFTVQSSGTALVPALSTSSNVATTGGDLGDPGVESLGTVALGVDQLSIEATTPGTAGDRLFTLEVDVAGASSVSGVLATTVVGDAITVDLGGVSWTTAEIATSIQNELAGFTVASSGSDSILANSGPAPATTAGGADPTPAVASSGAFTLRGETITFTADETGPDGDRPFTVALIDDGVGGLTTSIDGDTITVNLGGANSDTDAIAASIQTAINDARDAAILAGDPVGPSFTVQAGANVAVNTISAPTDVATTGGRAIDSITVSGEYAERVGFVPAGEDSVTVEDGTITSADRNPREVDSIFTTLIRMRDALEVGDLEQFERDVNQLDDDLDRVSFGRAEIGVRLKNLDAVADRLADEEVTLREALSTEIDADLIEVISEFTAKQAALQASLQTSGALLSLSILDFI